MDLHLHSGMHVERWRRGGVVTIGERTMEFGLQFGYGMMDHSRSLIRTWGGGSVILSPRDLDANQLAKLAQDVRDAGGWVYLDPQFYLPDADHARLTAHEYWPSQYATGAFWTGTELRDLLLKLASLNKALGCEAVLLPGVYGERADDDWLARQNLVIDEAAKVFDGPMYATIALGADAVKSDDDIDEILSAADAWKIAGVYLVCEHPQGQYLVDDPAWLANQLDLVAGLRLKGKDVLVGYANHQQLLVACAGATALASGTWMNVRSFPPAKFQQQYEEEIRQRSVWYYCPGALSEYKLAYLDIAQKRGVLDSMRPDPSLGSTHADVLFEGPQPSSIKWTEQSAFRHYLQCLRSQVTASRAASFDDTVSMHLRAFDACEKLIAKLNTAGVRGQNRSFTDCVDAGRAALGVLESNRGAVLRRRWQTL